MYDGRPSGTRGGINGYGERKGSSPVEKQKFSDREGLRIAAEMEKRGYTFYTHALRLAKSEVVKNLLKRLSDDEKIHYQAFIRLMENTESSDEAYEEEAAAFLSTIASEIAFPGGLMALGMEDGFDDPVKILLHGIQSEKDSILFYSEMVKQAKEPEVKHSFREIIREEVGHLRDLTAELEPYTK